MMLAKTVYALLYDAGMAWWNDKAPRLGAALAFYTTLSLSPILLIVVAISGLVFGEAAARGQIVGELRDLVGNEGAAAIEAMIANAWSPTANILAIAVGVATLLVGATGVFAQLQDALNTIWKAEPRSAYGVVGFFKDRLLSLSMIFGLGFLLLVSLAFNAGLSAIGTYVGSLLPTGWVIALQIMNVLLTFAVTAVMFTLIFKFLPDAWVAWTDAWVGATITAGLFIAGKFLIGLYLGMGSVGSSHGAAGSFVVLLMWIYYSTQIFLFGAELTQIYANRFGHRLVVAPPAEQSK